MCIMVEGNHDSALSGKYRAILNDRVLRSLNVYGSHLKIVDSIPSTPYSHVHVVCDEVLTNSPFFLCATLTREVLI